MQVHYELVFEVHESVMEPSSQCIREIMEISMVLEEVPMKVNIGIGANWGEAHL